MLRGRMDLDAGEYFSSLLGVALRVGLFLGILNQHLKPLYQTGANGCGILAVQHPMDDLPIHSSAEQAQCFLQSFEAHFQAVA